jgi:hypothetical protein
VKAKALALPGEKSVPDGPGLAQIDAMTAPLHPARVFSWRKGRVGGLFKRGRLARGPMFRPIARSS